MLAFIDADIISGKDEIAREQLLHKVSQYRTTGVAPLWVNSAAPSCRFALCLSGAMTV